jgi:hypothetical protein
MSRLAPLRSIAALSAALALVGCGGGAGDQRPLAQASIADQTRALERQLVSDQDIARRAARSPQRAFLKYWSAVQYGDMRGALLAFDPRLVRVVGAEDLASALRNAAPLYRTAKPDVRHAVVQGDTATIRYLAPTQRAGGRITPLSVALQRIGGAWRIVYSSALDDELRIAVQQDVQDRIKPGLEEFDRRAVSAGDAAARRQAIYLARVQPTLAAATGGSGARSESRARGGSRSGSR